jgi:dTMP kinase
LFVVVDAIDGAGKTTVVEELREGLRGDFKEIHVIHFPAYQTPLGTLIKHYLKEPPPNQFFMSLLFEVNRLEELPTLLLAKSSDVLVLADRFYHSGRAYALARGISDFQYQTLMSINADLPKPDLSFILDLDPKVASKRMTWKTLDALERNISFQTKVRQEFLELADAFDWQVVDATFSKEIVASQIAKIIRHHHKLE